MLGRGACEERERNFPAGQRKRRCLSRPERREDPGCGRTRLRLEAGMCLACRRSSLEARGAESELGGRKG